MKRSLVTRTMLAAVATLVAAGCATGREPARRPTEAGLTGTAASTTGDMDACAIALGNAAPVTGTTGNPAAANTTEVTANGIMIGNVALVALPTMDDMPLTPAGGAGVTVPNAAPNPAPAPGPAAETRTPGGALERAAVPGAAGGAEAGPMPGSTTGRPGLEPLTGGTAAGVGAGAGAAAGGGGNNATLNRGGTGGVGGPAWNTGTDTGMNAVDRIRVACPKVTQIRVVTDSGDRARLARMAMSIRKGEPVTDFMTELGRMAQRATNAGGGNNQFMQPGEPPALGPDLNRTGPTDPTGLTAPTSPTGLTAPAPGATPGAPAGTGTPAPGAYGTPPGTMGPGVTPPANR